MGQSERPGPRGHDMCAANGSGIATFGRIQVSIEADGRRYLWPFLIADVCLPILGADFLKHTDLLVDVRWQKLYHSTTSQLAATATADDYATQKQMFKGVFQGKLGATKAPAKHPVKYYIKTTGPPVYVRFRRLAPDRLAAAKRCFQEMEKQGLCQASSQWASPLHIVVKKDGTIRPCGDYRRLNNITEADHYPLPNIADVTSFLHGATVFSKLDLMKGYFQVPMHPEDIPKTAIVTPFGTYTFNYSCFGLKNAGATFQRLMDNILGDLPFCVCYVDDVLVFSNSGKQHLQHLKVVLESLSENGLIAREDKCIFGASEVEFLGHAISRLGVTPLQEKVEAIQGFPKPSTVRGLQEFLGLVTFYHRFLPSIASKLAPLNELLKGKPSSSAGTPMPRPPSGALSRPWQTLRSSPSQLQTPSCSSRLTPATSPLGQCWGNASTGRRRRWPSTVRSSLTPSGATPPSTGSSWPSTWRPNTSSISSRRSNFQIRTDHLPLVHAFSKKTDLCPSRQQRQLSAVSEFNCNLQHISGKSNTVADALSRNAVAMAHLRLDLQDLQRLQQEEDDAEREDMSLQWSYIDMGSEAEKILCDVSTGKPRP